MPKIFTEPEFDAMLKKLLRQILKQCSDAASNVAWTTAVKASLAQAGKDADYYVCCHGVLEVDVPSGEWLYDVTWLEIDQEPSNHVYVKRLALAAESEWGNHGDIVDDFAKLLTARADRRVMVFQARSNCESDKIHDKLLHAVSLFECTAANDVIYLACYREDGESGARFETSRIEVALTSCFPEGGRYVVKAVE